MCWSAIDVCSKAKDDQTVGQHCGESSVLQFPCSEPGKTLMLLYIHMKLKEMINISPQKSSIPNGGGGVGNYLE